MRRVLFLLVALLLVAACAAQDQGPGAPADEAALDFTAPTLGGGQLDAGSLEGRDVVLWFWAPW